MADQIDLNRMASGIDWDSESGQGYIRAVGELLGLGRSPDDLFARGRLTDSEHKASLILLQRAYRARERVAKKKAKQLGLDWPALSEQERAVKLNLALSISRDGAGRDETVSSLIGMAVRRVRRDHDDSKNGFGGEDK